LLKRIERFNFNPCKIEFFPSWLYISYFPFCELSLRNVCYYIFSSPGNFKSLLFSLANGNLYSYYMKARCADANGLGIFFRCRKKGLENILRNIWFEKLRDFKPIPKFRYFFIYFFVLEIEINHFNGETNISLLEIDFSTFIYSLRCYTTSNRIISPVKKLQWEKYHICAVVFVSNAFISKGTKLSEQTILLCHMSGSSCLKWLFRW